MLDRFESGDTIHESYGYCIFIFGGVVTLALFAGALVVLSFAFPTLPFVPSTKARVESLLALSGMRPGDTVVDIGSGDGRIVIACAQAGAIAHGYEINPLLVWWSRRRIRALGLGDRATIFATNFWRVDFSDYDIIFVQHSHSHEAARTVFEAAAEKRCTGCRQRSDFSELETLARGWGSECVLCR